MLYNLLSHPLVFIPTLVIAYVAWSVFKRSRVLELPIIGSHTNDWFPLLQAKWRNTIDFAAAMHQAYTQYRHQAVLLPVAGEGNIVLLPPEEISFVMDQPDSVLNLSARAFEMFQIDYTFMDPIIPRVTLHNTLLLTMLTPKLGDLIPRLAEETAWAFETYWGTETTEWREICVFDTMRHIAGSVANCAFVGRPCCRDPELVNNGMAFAADVPLSSTLIKLCWKPLRPVFAALFTIPNRIHTRRFRKILSGEIAHRLRSYDRKALSTSPEDKLSEPEPNDFLQWLIHQAKTSDDPYMWRIETLADRILTVNFAAIHSTSLTSTQAVFDLASTPSCIDELRQEAESVLAAHGGHWDKQALAEMIKLDSAIRESTRFSSILSIGLGRTIVAPDGVRTPSGIFLPQGTTIAVPALSIMRDEAMYPHADRYDPFRFSEKRQNGELSHVRRARNALATTSSDFLVFGHGRHACPGRFFAAAVLKLIMAHMLLYYEVKFLPERPQDQWFGAMKLPAMKATIMVRRREGA